MNMYKNFKDASDLEEYQKALKSSFGILFKVCDSGEDWYELTKDLTKNDSYKVLTSWAEDLKMDIVICFSKDATSLTPLSSEFNLIEVYSIPDGLSSNGLWAFDEETEEIYQRELTDSERLSKNKAKQKSLLDEAYQKLTPLNYAEDLGIASEKDVEDIQELKSYVVSLSKLDLTLKNLVWPLMGV